MKKRPHSLLHLATHIFDTPLMIHPRKLDVILSVLGPRLGIRTDSLPPITLDLDPPEDDNDSDLLNGLAVIPIYGSLVKRAMPMDAMSGMTSYEDLRSQIDEAMEDDQCTGILFDVDSPGGACAGVFELSDYIYSLRGQKPMSAVSNDAMYSAAYAIASAADPGSVYCTAVGGAGSIGVLIVHVDKTEQDKMDGLKYTIIRSGDRKAEGNSHEPITDAALAALQFEVDRVRDMFVDLVARNRGLDAKAVYDTQAACYYADGTVEQGLCDQVGSLDDAMEALGEDSDEASRSKVSMAGVKVNNRSALTAEQLEPDPVAAVAELVRAGPVRTPAALAKTYAGSDIELHVRHYAAQALVQPSARTITCCVAPYNTLSCDLGGFKEVYQPGCFTECLKTDDPLALFCHDMKYVLGRKSAGTARFLEKPDGLYFEADAPETQWASDLLVSMRRGDIKQGSAAFFILKPRWEYQGSQKVRVIEQAKLVESSIVSFAAYESTTASVSPEVAAAAAFAAVQVAAEQERLAAQLRLLAA